MCESVGVIGIGAMILITTPCSLEDYVWQVGGLQCGSVGMQVPIHVLSLQQCGGNVAGKNSA